MLWRLTRSINVFGGYEIRRFYESEDITVKPFFFSGSGDSQRWSLTPNLKVSRIISVLGTYEGRSERTFSNRQIVEHNFRIETRAFF